MSGDKRLIINTRERASSGDVNRLQTLLRADLSKAMRALYLDKRIGAFDYPGLTVRQETDQTPLQGMVLGGLMVRIDNPGYLTVDPGTLITFSGESGPDESQAQVCNSDGLTDVAALTFTANGGGQPRIDIVECRVVDALIESGSRDVWDVPTQTFVPTSVPKVRRKLLEFRLRLGVAGGGLPSMQSGWLPLAVACVQPGAASFAQTDFWDVRPLWDDRADLVQTDPSKQYTPVRDCEYETKLDGSSVYLIGYISAEYMGFRAGGLLRPSQASSLATFGLTTTTGGEAVGYLMESAAGAQFQPNFVYAVFPGGLPRWVRYQQTADVTYGRIPRGPRGILAGSSVAPGSNGVNLAVTLPAVNGFAGTHPGVLLSVLFGASPSQHGGAIGRGVWHRVATLIGAEVSLGAGSTAFTSGVGRSVSWASAIAGVLPFCARRMRLRFDFIADYPSYTPGTEPEIRVTADEAGPGTFPVSVGVSQIYGSGGTPIGGSVIVEMPAFPPRSSPFATSSGHWDISILAPSVLDSSLANVDPTSFSVVRAVLLEYQL